MDQSDLDIINAVRAGDKGAFYVLYQNYADLLYRNILVRVKSSFDADEILQDFFVTIWEKRESINIETNVKGYLLVWLKHHILNTIKKQQVRIKHQTLSQKHLEEADDYTWVKIVSEDLNAKLNEVVDGLPPRLKSVYILSREQHLSVKEIAERLSVSEQTVKNQLTDIMRRLKTEMNSKNFTFLIILLRING